MKIHVLISGKVQGVFYRAFTKKKADELGLKGWVRNLDDGKVEAVFEGSKEKVKKMIEWCWKGAQNSRVSRISRVSRVSREKLEGFEIRDCPGRR